MTPKSSGSAELTAINGDSLAVGSSLTDGDLSPPLPTASPTMLRRHRSGDVSPRAVACTQDQGAATPARNHTNRKLSQHRAANQIVISLQCTRSFTSATHLAYLNPAWNSWTFPIDSAKSVFGATAGRAQAESFDFLAAAQYYVTDLAKCRSQAPRPRVRFRPPGASRGRSHQKENHRPSHGDSGRGAG